MQSLANKSLVAISINNVDNSQTLFNLIMVLPTAKAVFERCPRQQLPATLSSLPSESKQLAILYVALIHDHHVRASMLPLVGDYLPPNETPVFMLLAVVAADLTIPSDISHFKTPRKVATVWNPLEDLSTGFVERSIPLIAPDALISGFRTTGGYK